VNLSDNYDYVAAPRNCSRGQLFRRTYTRCKSPRAEGRQGNGPVVLCPGPPCSCRLIALNRCEPLRISRANLAALPRTITFAVSILSVVLPMLACASQWARGGWSRVYRPDRSFTPVRIHSLQVRNIISSSCEMCQVVCDDRGLWELETTAQFKTQAGINGHLRLSRCARGAPPFIPFGSLRQSLNRALDGTREQAQAWS
jgi:hypothetical protein